jgi:hypothetical protein
MDATRDSFTPEDAEKVAGELGIDFEEVPFTLESFRRGMEVELEHGRRDPATNVTNDDPVTTGKIALAHLTEMADYYERLDRMEAEAEG